VGSRNRLLRHQDPQDHYTFLGNNAPIPVVSTSNI